MIPYKTKTYDFVIKIGKSQSPRDVIAQGSMAISVTKEELKILLRKGEKTLSSAQESKAQLLCKRCDCPTVREVFNKTGGYCLICYRKLFGKSITLQEVLALEE